MKPKLRIAGDSEKALPRKVSLTQATVPLLACPKGKGRVRIFDAKCKGLVLMVTATGRRSWYWSGRVKGLTRPVDYHIGDGDGLPLVEARRIAAGITAKAAEGIDPRAERQAAKQANLSAITVGELWEAFPSSERGGKFSTAFNSPLRASPLIGSGKFAGTFSLPRP